MLIVPLAALIVVSRLHAQVKEPARNLPARLIDAEGEAGTTALAEMLAWIGAPGQRELTALFLIKPNVCPRCESLVPPLAEQVDAVLGDRARSIGIIHSVRGNVARRYVGDVSFPFPTMIDSTGLAERLGLTDLPLVTLWGRDGCPLYAHPLLGFNEQANVEFGRTLQTIRRHLDDGEKHASNAATSVSEKGSDAKIPDPGLTRMALRRLGSTSLEDADRAPIGRFGIIHFAGSRNQFVAVDLGTLRIRIYDAISGRFLRELGLPQSARRKFSPTFDSSEFAALEKTGGVRTMILGCTMTPDEDTIFAIASMPKVARVIEKGDTSLYVNVEQAIIRYVYRDTLPVFDGLVPIEYPGTTANSQFFTMMYRMWQGYDRASFYFQTVKGFPQVPRPEGPHDIRVDSFYRFAPVFVLNRAGGSIAGYHGRLDGFYAEHRLGYNVNMPSMVVLGPDSVLYTQSLVPKVFLGDREAFPLVQPAPFFADDRVLDLPLDSLKGSDLRRVNEAKLTTVDEIAVAWKRYYLVAWALYEPQATFSAAAYAARISYRGVALQLYDRTGRFVGSTTLTLEPGMRFIRAIPLAADGEIAIVTQGEDWARVDRYRLEP